MSTQGSDTIINFNNNQHFSRVLQNHQGSLYLCKVVKSFGLASRGKGKRKLMFMGKSLNILCSSKQIKHFKILDLSELSFDLGFQHDLKHWNFNQDNEEFFRGWTQVFGGEKVL